MLYWIPVALHVALALLAGGHALLYKRDPRSAFGWIAVCLFFPVAGALLYYLFGINRVQTRARKKVARVALRELVSDSVSALPDGADALPQPHSEQAPSWLPTEYSELARVSSALSRNPLTGGNSIEGLHDGEQAYPAMLGAIEDAKRTLHLATYILDTDSTGRRFIEALGRAHRRGVDVRVLIDGIGEWYSWPHAGRLLRREGVPVARFFPPRLFPPSVSINLRNHRKILVADSRVGFTGGMNIGDRQLAVREDGSPGSQDIHFRLEGSVVAQLERAFFEDWVVATGSPPVAGGVAPDPRPKQPSATLARPPEQTTHAEGTTPGESRGGPRPTRMKAVQATAVCRVLLDGPDEDLDTLDTIFVAAVSAARRQVAVMTPYFLPSRELIGALQAAALRGVDVAVILPAENNLPYVQWATTNMLWELLQRGVRVFYQPPPFAHTKLFVVDGHYSLVGSANLDPRSLRLNFELDVEVYERLFAEILLEHFKSVRAASREIFLADVDSRSVPRRVRDSLAWLFTPYL